MKCIRRPGLPLSLLLLTVLLTGCPGPGERNPLPAPATPTPSPATGVSPLVLSPEGQATPRSFAPQVEVVANGLEAPWALAFASYGRLFFTERPGRVRVLTNGQLQAQPVAQLAVAETGESGLMGLALDPDFAENGYLYVMYTYLDGLNMLQNRVSRLTLEGNKAGKEKVILDNISGNAIHDGGRIKFGPDAKLYVTTGDATNPSRAQDLKSLNGKILRLNADGSIPADNPFPGSPVYSYGHRNPQGLAWDPATGQLFETEHGPVGNDEVNIIRPGKNYGWPIVQGVAHEARFADPIAVYSPSVAPAGLILDSDDRLLGWTGNLIFATLRGEHLHRLVLRDPDFNGVVAEEKLFEGQYGRLRDVTPGPDGHLYFSTSNRDGRGRPAPDDDKILRIVPIPK